MFGVGKTQLAVDVANTIIRECSVPVFWLNVGSGLIRREGSADMGEGLSDNDFKQKISQQLESLAQQMCPQLLVGNVSSKQANLSLHLGAIDIW